VTARHFISDNEVVARALFEPEWDPQVKRGSPGCFKRNNTSVTRCKDNTQQSVINLLKRDVEKGNVVVKAVGLIEVSVIKSIGDSSGVVYFEVEHVPTEKNQSHSEILAFDSADKINMKKQVPRGISSKINNGLHLLIIDESGMVYEEIPPTKA